MVNDGGQDDGQHADGGGVQCGGDVRGGAQGDVPGRKTQTPSITKSYIAIGLFSFV